MNRGKRGDRSKKRIDNHKPETNQRKASAFHLYSKNLRTATQELPFALFSLAKETSGKSNPGQAKYKPLGKDRL